MEINGIRQRMPSVLIRKSLKKSKKKDSRTNFCRTEEFIVKSDFC